LFLAGLLPTIAALPLAITLWSGGTLVAADNPLPPAPPPSPTVVKPAPDAKVAPSTGAASKAQPAAKEKPPAKPPAKKPEFPEKVLKVLEYVDKYGKPMDGYVGGGNFGNFEKHLPQTDDKGRRIKYREWDVNPKLPGVNRGAERLVTGSDRHAYYTSDHYRSFRKIR
jgi:guanyl-specific ribonuclease Sa